MFVEWLTWLYLINIFIFETMFLCIGVVQNMRNKISSGHAKNLSSSFSFLKKKTAMKLDRRITEQRLTILLQNIE